MHIRERLRRWKVRAERKVFGPSPKDRDCPDPRPENPLRDRFEAAERMRGVEKKEEVMSVLSEVIIGSWTEYEYRAGYYGEVRRMAWNKAVEMGVSIEEIEKVVRSSNIVGATARQGSRDYFL